MRPAPCATRSEAISIETENDAPTRLPSLSTAATGFNNQPWTKRATPALGRANPRLIPLPRVTGRRMLADYALPGREDRSIRNRRSRGQGPWFKSLVRLVPWSKNRAQRRQATGTWCQQTRMAAQIARRLPSSNPRLLIKGTTFSVCAIVIRDHCASAVRQGSAGHPYGHGDRILQQLRQFRVWWPRAWLAEGTRATGFVSDPPALRPVGDPWRLPSTRRGRVLVVPLSGREPRHPMTVRTCRLICNRGRNCRVPEPAGM